MLGKWIDFLKENDKYDNTRIIIVSDHGVDLNSKFQDNIVLLNNKRVQAYAALLLVKDFNSHGFLSIDDMFMTNADIPIIALEDIVKNPVNP
jgi:arylsulfatase A-like enzyme